MRGNAAKRDEAGRYSIEQRCDCCSMPIRGEHASDADACGATDGPGFFLCSRARCEKRRDGLDVDARRSLYAAGRAKSESM